MFLGMLVVGHPVAVYDRSVAQHQTPVVGFVNLTASMVTAYVFYLIIVGLCAVEHSPRIWTLSQQHAIVQDTL